MKKNNVFPIKEPSSIYDNNVYHEECLRCNACGVNLTGPNQKRARRFKNQIFCDLHFADVALMESSDFMQQLRAFKPQSLGCAVARRKSSTTLIFPLPPQACSGESRSLSPPPRPQRQHPNTCSNRLANRSVAMATGVLTHQATALTVTRTARSLGDQSFRAKSLNSKVEPFELRVSAPIARVDSERSHEAPDR